MKKTIEILEANLEQRIQDMYEKKKGKVPEKFKNDVWKERNFIGWLKSSNAMGVDRQIELCKKKIDVYHKRCPKPEDYKFDAAYRTALNEFEEFIDLKEYTKMLNRLERVKAILIQNNESYEQESKRI